MRGSQWLSLSCQWELTSWMCVCFVVSCLISIFLFHLFNILDFYLKSSDLSMVNPHISLNPWNPLIHGAILRFSEDFYYEIHGFCWQSSDLAQGIYFIKSSSGSEEFIFFCLIVCVTVDRDCLIHNLCVGPTFTQIVVSESWIFQDTDLDLTQITAVCVRSFPLISILFISSWNLHVWGEILEFPYKSLDKSSDCVDFTKSRDLLDWSENIKFSSIFL